MYFIMTFDPPRCPQYNSLPSADCEFVSDPSDPCCQIPICHSHTNTTQPPGKLIEIPGVSFEVTSVPGTRKNHFLETDILLIICIFISNETTIPV